MISNRLIERAIGALLKKHPKVARFYQLSHESGVLRVECDDARLEAPAELYGDDVLKTDHSLVNTCLPLEDGRVIEIHKPSLPDAE